MYNLVDGFLDRIKAEFPRIFTTASEIYVIGYRGNDSLMQKMLSYVPEKTVLHVVNHSEAGKIQEKIMSIVPGKLVKGQAFSEGFSSFVNELGK